MKLILAFLLVWTLAGPELIPTSGPIARSIVGVTENPDARKDFEKGLLLLHNFEYADAAEIFRSAQKKDPHFALAWWGEAMTYNHPIWLSQDYERARAVIKNCDKISRTRTRKLTTLEADLLKSLDHLYGEGAKQQRDKAYSDFMATLFHRYKGNEDVAAFYALSLLGVAGGWDETLCNQAADIAGAILKENPDHPGALHYFIHAEDHPDFARIALDQANRYANIASYSGHALHMPSHIYLALGLWDDVVKSNEVSWQAGIDRKEAKKLNNNALNYHAHWWLAYGYLQQGRFAKAEKLVRNQLTFTRTLASAPARTHFVIMRGHFLLETNDWNNSLADEEVKTQDLRIEIRTLDRFLKGLKAHWQHDEKTLTSLTAEIEKDIKSAQQISIIADGITQCNAPPSGSTGIRQATILLEELKGLQAQMKKDNAGARLHFEKAVELEEANGHFFGPPEILKPTSEFYGEFLLTTRDYEGARANFENALRKTPGRNQSLWGLSEAYQRTGMGEKEKQVSEAIELNLHNSDGSPVKPFFHPN